MRIFWNQVLVVLSIPVLVACGASGAGINRVTAIPDIERTNTPTPTTTLVVSDTEVPTETATAVLTQAPTQTNGVQTSDEDSKASATPIPLSNGLEAGESRSIALATDTVMQPTPREQLVTFDQQPVRMTFDEFYDGFHPRYGLILSDKLVSLDGRQVVIEGYMAPPLKPALDWFVLTKIPLALCPFCSTDADWPNDIALVYMPENETVLATTGAVRIVGRMEVGSSIDAETGMVSIVRIYIEELEILG